MTDLSFYRKNTRPWQSHLLGTGAIVGHTTHSSTRIWVRTKYAGSYDFVVCEKDLHGLQPPIRVDGGVLIDASDKKQRIIYHEPFDIQDDIDVPIEDEDPPRDHTKVFDVGGEQSGPLSAGTEYHYQVVARTKGSAEGTFTLPGKPRFRTLPKSDSKLQFAFYSCHMPFKGKSTVDVGMWELFLDDLRRCRPQFVLGGGDQVYVDGEKHIDIWKWLAKVKSDKPELSDMLSWYRDIYRGYWGFDAIKAVYSEFPNYMIWDDHEIMDGWGSYTERELADVLDRWYEWQDTKENLRLTYEMRRAAELAYVDYQHSHNPPTGRDENQKRILDYEFAPGPSDFFVLDMRGHKDFDANHDYRVLGKSQHDRLEDWSSRTLGSKRSGPIFVVSPVPVVHLRDFAMNLSDWFPILGLEDDVRDHWEHKKNRVEITKLLDMLFKLSHDTSRPLVFLSGDVHIGAIFSMTHPEYPKAKVFQVTSSGITYAALGDTARAGLAAAVKTKGKVSGTHVTFRNHFVYSQQNFSLFTVEMEGRRRTNRLEVELVGRSPRYPGMAERFTVDLLSLKKRRN